MHASKLLVYPRRDPIPLGTQEGGKSETRGSGIPVARIGLIS